MSARWQVIVLMLAAVVALSAGEALLARGMKQSAAPAGSLWAQVRAVVQSAHVIGGVGLLVVYLVLSMLALRTADLSYVLPLTALSYPLGALLAQVYLHEPVNLTRWLGTLVITLGVAIVGFGEASAR